MLLQNIANYNEFFVIFFIIFFFVFTGIFLRWICVYQPTRNFFGYCESIVPTLIGVPAVMFSLTAALMASSLWENYSSASKAIRNESQGLSSYTEIVEMSPIFRSRNLSGYAKAYKKSIIEDEWSKMGQSVTLIGTNEKFQEFQLATFEAINSPGVGAEGKLLVHEFERILDGRQARLGSTMFDVHPVRWIAVLMLGFLVQLGVAMAHIQKPMALTQALSITTATILTALCTMALTLSNPYVGILSISNISYL